MRLWTAERVWAVQSSNQPITIIVINQTTERVSTSTAHAPLLARVLVPPVPPVLMVRAV